MQTNQAAKKVVPLKTPQFDRVEAQTFLDLTTDAYDFEGTTNALVSKSTGFSTEGFVPHADLLSQITKTGMVDVYFHAVHHSQERAATEWKRRGKSQGRGSNKSAELLTCLWSDLDTDEKDNQTGSNPYPSRSHVMETLHGMECPPSIVVDSGTGVHAYWSLDQAYSAQEHPDSCNLFNDALACLLGEGAGHDRLGDLARVMRLPGTIHNDSGKTVRVIESTGKRYSLDELMNYAEAVLANAGDRGSNTTTLTSTPTDGTNITQAVGGVVGAFNTNITFDELLPMFGYTLTNESRQGVESVWLHPDSSTGQGGMMVFDGGERAYSHNGGDTMHGQHSFDPFQLWETLQCGGDRKEAIQTAAQLLKDRGIEIAPHLVRGGVIDMLAFSDKRRTTTDLGNLERLADLTAGNVRFIPELRQWIVWDGSCWLALPSILSVTRQVIRSIYREAASMDDPDDRKRMSSWAFMSESKARIDSMTALATQDEAITLSASLLDNHPHLIGCKDGVVDLESGELLEPDRSLYVTRSVNASFSTEAECPRFEQFISEIMNGDQEMINFMQMFCGYLMHGGNPEQVVAILHGGGSNGKSVLLALLLHLFSEYGRTIDPATLTINPHGGSGSGPREDLLRLYRCRLGITTETADGDTLDEGLIKKLSGGESIVARGVHARTSLEFAPEFVALIGTNHVPIIRGTDHGVWRRIVLIPFSVKFSDKQIDKHLLSKLKAESDGIFQWLLYGYWIWSKIGWILPNKVKAATSQYRDEMDILGEWIKEYCEVRHDYKEHSDALYQHYRIYATGAGLGILSKNKLTRRLKERGYPIDYSGSFEGVKKPIIGIRLMKEAQDRVNLNRFASL